MIEQSRRETAPHHQGRVIALLERILAAIIEPPRRPKTSADDEMIVRVIRVTTASTLTNITAFQGPDVQVALGYSVIIRQRNHAGAPEGGLAFSKNGINNPETRILLNDGDAITVRISNFNKAWFAADTVDTYFEMIGVL